MNKKMSKMKGFTLLELMIVVVIVGILATFAYASYQQYILRSHRVDARNMLQEIQQKLESNYTITRSYNKLSDDTAINNDTLSAWGLDQSPAIGDARYKISFKEAPTLSTYILQAVPQNAQKNDECGSFVIDYRNVKTIVDPQGVTKNARDDLSRRCWSR